MAVMGSWVFRLLVIGSTFSVFWGDIEVGCYAEGEKDHLVNFITWDDMKVDLRKQRLDWREDKYNKSRVIVIDQSGHGDSVTVQGAVDMVPMHNSERVKIYILPGIYREKVFIPDSKPYISIIGVENLLVCREKVFIPDSKPYISIIGVENRTSETIITWNDKASDKEKDGSELGTYRSASVAIESDFFCATGITIENSVVAVPGAYGNQAVALRISGNKAMFYRVRILGTQDTLLDDCGSHYFYQCYIQGSIDFVFGSSRSLYQDCVLHSTAKRYGAIAAHYRDSQEDDTGFSFVNCTINGTGTVYLGRAWGNYSRAIYSYCDIDNVVTPSGWSDWNQPSRQKTAVFGEFQCRGKGADRRKRVAWSKSFSYEEVKPFLDMTFISGDKWLRL